MTATSAELLHSSEGELFPATAQPWERLGVGALAGGPIVLAGTASAETAEGVFTDIDPSNNVLTRQITTVG